MRGSDNTDPTRVVNPTGDHGPADPRNHDNNRRSDDANRRSVGVRQHTAAELSLVVKVPGPALTLSTAPTSLPLRTVPGADPLPPYVRLIHDVLLVIGRCSLVRTAWKHVWQMADALLDKPEPVTYPKGSWGQAQTDRLAEPIGWLLR
jgi:glucose-6-phosphate 1-dehydrogenase